MIAGMRRAGGIVELFSQLEIVSGATPICTAISRCSSLRALLLARMCSPSVSGGGCGRSAQALRLTFVNGKKATRPCPCGHLGSPLRACRCTPDVVARYQGRISGPLLDRIDVQVEVPAVPPEALAAAPDGESSSAIAQRVAVARQRAVLRQGCANAELSGDALDRHCALDATASKFLQIAAARLGWSARGFHRVLRIARSIADLGESDDIQISHLAEAIQCRRMLAAH